MGDLMRRSFFAVSLALAFAAGSAIWAAPRSIKVDAPDPEQEAVAEIMARPEWEWLRDGEEELHVETFRNGAVYLIGYYPSDEITAQRLAAFHKDIIAPNLIAVRTGTAKVRSVEVLWHQVPGHPAMKCGAIMQAISGKNAASPGRSEIQAKASLRRIVPQVSLNPDCTMSRGPGGQ